ncbi:MAG: EamA family transporter [Clostridia bacterium]|nr:EamA family transporter [Clostridia bacterium]
MWFIFAIAALLCWSGSDLFSKIGSRPDDKYSHWKMVMAVGLVMGLHAMFEIFVSGVEINLSIIIKYLPASLLYIISMVFGYVGLRYIELSVSSPICNSSGALAALMCFVFLGDRLSGGPLAGVIIVCAGVIFLGITEYTEDENQRKLRQEKCNIKYSKSLVAILIPIIYCILDAAGTFTDSIILETLNEESANVAYELTFLLMGIISFVYVVIIKKDNLVPSREVPKLIGGICETAGQFAYVFAISENTIMAAPVISAYCAASVLWSRIFLKEKLSAKHYAAIAVTVIGIIILGVFDI